jgi:hypothetical protein
MERIICYVFEDVGGYYFCNYDNVEKTGWLDARGHNYKSSLEAKRAAKNYGYTHAMIGKQLLSLATIKTTKD